MREIVRQENVIKEKVALEAPQRGKGKEKVKVKEKGKGKEKEEVQVKVVSKAIAMAAANGVTEEPTAPTAPGVARPSTWSRTIPESKNIGKMMKRRRRKRSATRSRERLEVQRGWSGRCT